MPDTIPDVRGRLAEWRGLDYVELAACLMQPFVDLERTALAQMLERSYSAFAHPQVTPVVRVGPVHVIELFHGPTLAFKDLALQFLGQVFEHILVTSGGEINIVGATSGDTGSAAIQGVRGKTGVRIFMMHPHQRISPTQERQMTTVLDTNVFNTAIKGTFDDCQAIMKAIFNDLPFKDRYSLGSVNSINWARLLAQIVYYFFGTFRVMEKTGAREVNVSVPTGNFGDIFAGYMAARMGLPIRRLILATNENDILARFFNCGRYARGKVRATLSPSMDIQVASNFERYLYYRVGEDGSRVRGLMEQFAETGEMEIDTRAEGGVDPLFAAKAVDTDAALRTMRECHERYGYLLDPHTAVGVCAALETVSDDTPTLCLATAHPAKFSEAVERAVGQNMARHSTIDGLAGRPTRVDILPASVNSVKAYIGERIASS